VPKLFAMNPFGLSVILSERVEDECRFPNTWMISAGRFTWAIQSRLSHARSRYCLEASGTLIHFFKKGPFIAVTSKIGNEPDPTN
jgi:hypothetical protein